MLKCVSFKIDMYRGEMNVLCLYMRVGLHLASHFNVQITLLI